MSGFMEKSKNHHMSAEDAANNLLSVSIQSLKDACRREHAPGPGASRLCICGASCGGSPACSALFAIRDAIRYKDNDRLEMIGRML